MEPRFAEAKQWHGLRRFRLRGLKNANIQGLLAATGWGRRHTLCGSLVALPNQPLRPATVCG